MNALSDEESEFRRMGKAMFTATPRTLLRDAVRQFTPALYGLIGGHLQSVEIEQFFINVITDTIKYRREHKVVRPDFIHMLMELQDHPEKIDNIGILRIILRHTYCVISIMDICKLISESQLLIPVVFYRIDKYDANCPSICLFRGWIRNILVDNIPCSLRIGAKSGHTGEAATGNQECLWRE